MYHTLVAKGIPQGALYTRSQINRSLIEAGPRTVWRDGDEGWIVRATTVKSEPYAAQHRFTGEQRVFASLADLKHFLRG